MSHMKPRKRKVVLLIALVVVATLFGVLMLQKYQASHELPVEPPQPRQAGKLKVTLFFSTVDGALLSREGREIDGCSDLAACIDAVVEELVNGPLGELAPTLPPGAGVHEVRFTGETAVIDFDRGLPAGIPEGSSAEMMAVYSVVNSICFNFPQVKSVQFLVDGKPVETLKGHLDLRQPIPPNPELEKKEAGKV